MTLGSILCSEIPDRRVRKHERRRLSRFVSAVLFLIALYPMAVNAQVPAPASQTELIQQLLQRIDRLEKRVAELEADRPQADKKTPVPGAEASVMAAMDHDHGTLVDATAGSASPALRISATILRARKPRQPSALS